MICGLYNIKAKNTFTLKKASETDKGLYQAYGKLITSHYDSALPFSIEPTVEDVIGWLKFLRPSTTFDPNSVEITYIGEYDTSK